MSGKSPRMRLAKRHGALTRSGIRRDITPMIDVVFLLLIFFMCTLDFKQLDSKLATYLPKEKGQQVNYEDLEPVETMRIQLSMQGERCVCRFNGKSIGLMPGGRKALYARVDAMRSADPGSPALITVDPAVPHKHVVGVVDECARANVAEITFAAALPALARR